MSDFDWNEFLKDVDPDDVQAQTAKSTRVGEKRI